MGVWLLKGGWDGDLLMFPAILISADFNGIVDDIVPV